MSFNDSNLSVYKLPTSTVYRASIAWHSLPSHIAEMNRKNGLKKQIKQHHIVQCLSLIDLYILCVCIDM